MKEKIAVLGAGAIGSSVGADLTRAGHDVALIDQWPAHVDAMKASGLRVVMQGEELHTPVRACHLCEVCTLNEQFITRIERANMSSATVTCRLFFTHPFVPGASSHIVESSPAGRTLLRLSGVLVPVLVFVLSAGAAFAQSAPSSDYPRKPVRLVVPFSPGGPVDIVARSISPRMGEILGQQILVDNRGGAGSTIGTEIVAKSPADGYTLLMVSGSYVMNPAMLRKLPYDSIKDFAPISIVAEVPSALVVHPALPVKNLKQLVALAKARPGELNYSTPGRGTLGHLAAEWFSSVAGVKMVHVPYKGAGPALVELMAGHVQLLFAAMPGLILQTREGKLRMLAQGGKARSRSAPDVPTFVESGLPGFVLSSNFGLLAPAGTPRPVIERVRSALVEALADPAVNDRLASLGAERVGSTPEEHDAFTKSEIAKWMKVTREAGIQPQ